MITCIMKHLAVIILSATLAVVVAACGKGKESPSSEQAEMQRNALYAAMNSGDVARIQIVADSLAMNFDDLNTDESVAVLLAYLQIHNDAASRKDQKKDLEAIRAFVDAYNIALSIHGDNLIEAFNAARELNGNVNLPELAQSMSEQLADYDAGFGEVVSEPEAPKAETQKVEEPKAEEPKPDAPKEEKHSGEDPTVVIPLD